MKNEPIKPISVNDYIFKHDAAICPLCMSTDITSDKSEMDGSIGTALVQCISCGSYWNDIWEVTSYSDLNKNMDQEELQGVMNKAKKIKLSLT